ncbi:MAG: hypothetical protein FWE48_04325 [Coriobacteriia bacterium]|nr:hypothetical protein [Coriobacteriia bacterium]
MKLLKLTLAVSLTLTLFFVFAACGVSDRVSAPEILEDVEASVLVQGAPETTVESLREAPNPELEFRILPVEAFEGSRNQLPAKKRADKLGQVKGLEYEEVSQGINLSWKPVLYAEGYEVFHSTRKYAQYSRIAQVQETAHIHLDPTEGKTNYYKVRAYKYLHGNLRRGSLSTPIALKYSQ